MHIALRQKGWSPEPRDEHSWNWKHPMMKGHLFQTWPDGGWKHIAHHGANPRMHIGLPPSHEDFNTYLDRIQPGKGWGTVETVDEAAKHYHGNTRCDDPTCYIRRALPQALLHRHLQDYEWEHDSDSGYGEDKSKHYYHDVFPGSVVTRADGAWLHSDHVRDSMKSDGGYNYKVNTYGAGMGAHTLHQHLQKMCDHGMLGMQSGQNESEQIESVADRIRAAIPHAMMHQALHADGWQSHWFSNSPNREHESEWEHPGHPDHTMTLYKNQEGQDRWRHYIRGRLHRSGSHEALRAHLKTLGPKEDPYAPGWAQQQPADEAAQEPMSPALIHKAKHKLTLAVVRKAGWTQDDTPHHGPERWMGRGMGHTAFYNKDKTKWLSVHPSGYWEMYHKHPQGDDGGWTLGGGWGYHDGGVSHERIASVVAEAVDTNAIRDEMPRAMVKQLLHSRGWQHPHGYPNDFYHDLHGGMTVYRSGNWTSNQPYDGKHVRGTGHEDLRAHLDKLDAGVADRYPKHEHVDAIRQALPHAMAKQTLQRHGWESDDDYAWHPPVYRTQHSNDAISLEPDGKWYHDDHPRIRRGSLVNLAHGKTHHELDAYLKQSGQSKKIEAVDKDKLRTALAGRMAHEVATQHGWERRRPEDDVFTTHYQHKDRPQDDLLVDKTGTWFYGPNGDFRKAARGDNAISLRTHLSSLHPYTEDADTKEEDMINLNQTAEQMITERMAEASFRAGTQSTVTGHVRKSVGSRPAGQGALPIFGPHLHANVVPTGRIHHQRVKARMSRRPLAKAGRKARRRLY
jgi:hypothetical protein